MFNCYKTCCYFITCTTVIVIDTKTGLFFVRFSVHTQRLSSYCAVNTLRLCYHTQLVNWVYENNRCLFWGPYKIQTYYVARTYKLGNLSSAIPDAITGRWCSIQDTSNLGYFLRIYLTANLQQILKNSGHPLQHDIYDFLIIINFESFYTDRNEENNDWDLLEIFEILFQKNYY